MLVYSSYLSDLITFEIQQNSGNEKGDFSKPLRFRRTSGLVFSCLKSDDFRHFPARLPVGRRATINSITFPGSEI
jgi:hypothetical protein